MIPPSLPLTVEEADENVVYMCFEDHVAADNATFGAIRNLSCGRRDDVQFCDEVSLTTSDAVDIDESDFLVESSSEASTGDPAERKPHVSTPVRNHRSGTDTQHSSKSGRTPERATAPPVGRPDGESGADATGTSPSKSQRRETVTPTRQTTTPRKAASTGRTNSSPHAPRFHTGYHVTSQLSSATSVASDDTPLQPAPITPSRSAAPGDSAATLLEKVMYDAGAYTVDSIDSEFQQSYTPAPAAVMGFGSMVTPARNELNMFTALSQLGDVEGLVAFEKTMYQTCVLRSRAFDVAWSKFMQRINDIIRISVQEGMGVILELLERNAVSDTMLPIILVDLGVVSSDQRIVLDKLFTSLSSSGDKKHVFVKVNIMGNVQASLESIYTSLKGLMPNNRKNSVEAQPLDISVRKSIMEQIVDLFKTYFRSRNLVLIIEKITNNLNELLFIFEKFKSCEGVAISCILCSNCWETNLEHHISPRVYSGLSIVNCDVVSVNKLSDDLLNVLLFDSEIQCFIPHMHMLQQSWNMLYNEEMSVSALIKRIYSMYDSFFRNSQFSFVCMPDIVDMRSAVHVSNNEPYFEVYRNEKMARDLFIKLGLLFCGCNLSESHVAYLQVILDKQASMEAFCLQVMPYESMKLIERRLSLQLGIYLLNTLMGLLPDCDRARSRLGMLVKILCSEHAAIRINDLIKRISRVIRAKQDQSLADLIATMKDLGIHFLTFYPAAESISRFLGTPPKYDLVEEYLDTVRADSTSTTVATFVEHALGMLMLPTIQSCSKLAYQMVVAKFTPFKTEWHILRDILEQNECTGFAEDLKHLIRSSRTLSTREVNVWDLFCLFHAKFAADPISKTFVRFSMALETAIHILGYYAVSTSKVVQLISPGIESCSSSSVRLAHVIKGRLSRFKVRRIHMGK
ncbi:hypothetical protein, conserved [Babesia bigemina]|uniref:Uncharacterized protein n=1 Tax=Babesia bigemina TaxID=5866 RepID=A0A061D5Q7_BABBI|nr:hypothetical protein, conserved [Babesia bigemina]CDR96056.1 hypothetical protein, conserved [Babesia bigemina]|eukprot:XP_012768242.1 hypothetical protein, conserved [Babesia bigemina]